MIARIFPFLLIAPTLGLAQAQQHEFARLWPAPVTPQALCGKRAAVDGGWLVVGAPTQTDASGQVLGSVEVFERCSTGWEHRQALMPASLTLGAQFGWDVSLEDSTLIVGAQTWGGLFPGPTQQIGRVYVFELRGSTWNLVQEIEPPLPQAMARFGNAVDLDGDRMVIGSYLYDHTPTVADPFGSVFVYERDAAGTWSLTAHIPRPSGPNIVNGWSVFGRDVDLDGDRIAVAPSSDGYGAAFTYVLSGGSWVLEQQFQRPGGVNGERDFGYSVALDGERLAIGEKWAISPFGGGPGHVFTYHWTPGGWVNDADLVSPTPQYMDRMGWAVDLDGPWLLAGAPQQSDQETFEGKAYLYEDDPVLGWVLRREFAAEAPSPHGDWLGSACALDVEHGWALVGAKDAFDLSAGARPGAALLFTLDLGTSTCASLPNSTGTPATLSVLGSEQASEQRLTLATRDLPPGALGIHVMGPTAAPVPLASGELCIGLPFHRLFPIAQAGPDGVTLLDLDGSTPAVANQVLPGSTWSFQLWYRDTVGGLPTANLSSSVEVTFE